MNEFIVWYSNDKNEDKFSMEFSLQELIRQDHLDYISDSKQLVNYKVDSINRGIGLKDISNKNIYADSSIVEFKMLINKQEVNIMGYFSYIEEELRYEFYQYFNQRKSFIKAYLSPNDSRIIEKFKIIDTTQENKLGLIK